MESKEDYGLDDEGGSQNASGLTVVAGIEEDAGLGEEEEEEGQGLLGSGLRPLSLSSKLRVNSYDDGFGDNSRSWDETVCCGKWLLAGFVTVLFVTLLTVSSLASTSEKAPHHVVPKGGPTFSIPSDDSVTPGSHGAPFADNLSYGVKSAQVLPPRPLKQTLFLDPKQFKAVSQVVLSVGVDQRDLIVRFTAEEVTRDNLGKGLSCSAPSAHFVVQAWELDLESYASKPSETAASASFADHVGCLVSANKGEYRWHYYVAELKGLEPGKEYTYQIGMSEHGSGGEVADKQQPRTLKLKVPPLERPTVACIGDSQKSGNRGDGKVVYNKLEDALKAGGENAPSFWIHVGDMSYASNNGGCYSEKARREPQCQFDCPASDPVCKRTASARVTEPDFQSWDAFLSLIEPVSSRIPLLTQMGNHDNDMQWFLKFRPPHPSSYHDMVGTSLATRTQVFGARAANRIKLFETSYKGKPAIEQQALLNELLAEPFFYAVDVGPIHMVSYKSEDNAVNPYERVDHDAYAGKHTPGEDRAVQSPEDFTLAPGREQTRFDQHFGKDSPQLRWLRQDLASVNRSKTPFVLVFSHRPLFHTSSHHPVCDVSGDWFKCELRNMYMQIFEENHVDLVLAGHSHHYMLSYPVTFDNASKKISSAKKAGAGQRLPSYAIIGTGGYEVTNRFLSKPDYVRQRSGQHYGYANLRPRDDKTLEWQFIVAKDISGRNKEMEQVLI